MFTGVWCINYITDHHTAVTTFFLFGYLTVLAKLIKV